MIQLLKRLFTKSTGELLTHTNAATQAIIPANPLAGNSNLGKVASQSNFSEIAAQTSACTYLLSKSTYIKGLQCTKALYLNRFHPEFKTPQSIETLLVFKKGRNFESEIKETFGEGIRVDELCKKNFPIYPACTNKLLAEYQECVLFEAGFVRDEVLVLADVVRKNADQTVDVFEIKLSSELSEVILADVAVQYWVCKHNLPQLKTFNVILRTKDNSYRIIDVTEEVKQKMALVQGNVSKLKAVLLSQSIPSVSMGNQCDHPYSCDFKEHCSKSTCIS